MRRASFIVTSSLATWWITPEGCMKVLDFGLAKLIASPATGAGDVQRTELTLPGTLTGTPAYMSPEQALGQTVDARSDVFSFGVILFEMVTGRRPFQGDSHLSVLHKLVYDDPPSSRDLRPDAPERLHALITRCLQKDQNLRLSSMRAVCQELATMDGPAVVPASKAVTGRQRPAWMKPVAAVLILLGVLSLLWITRSFRPGH